MNTSLLAGAQVRFMAAFDQDTVIAELPKSTMLMGVPTFYTRLLDDARTTKNTCANMRLFVSGSAPLLAETHTAFFNRTGHRILERYGMTETNMIASNPFNGDRIAGTVGYALVGTEVEITNVETGTPLPTGEIGTTCFRAIGTCPKKPAKNCAIPAFSSLVTLGSNPKMDASVSSAAKKI